MCLGLSLAGYFILKFRQSQLCFLGSSLIVIGAVLLAAGLILKCSDVAPHAANFLFTCPTSAKWYGHMVMFLIAAAWLLAVGVCAQNGFWLCSRFSHLPVRSAAALATGTRATACSCASRPSP